MIKGYGSRLRAAGVPLVTAVTIGNARNRFEVSKALRLHRS